MHRGRRKAAVFDGGSAQVALACKVAVSRNFLVLGFYIDRVGWSNVQISIGGEGGLLHVSGWYTTYLPPFPRSDGHLDTAKRLRGC
jgi:hypothetical protein